jgi:hypothetical protein
MKHLFNREQMLKTDGHASKLKGLSAIPLGGMMGASFAEQWLSTSCNDQKCQTPSGLTKKLLGFHCDMASPAMHANLDLFHLNAAGRP